MRTLLFAPPSYWRLTPEKRAAICNGCGSRSTWWVPDTIWGLCITPACNIHDFMYVTGATIEEKEAADRVFLNNMLRLVRDNTSSKILTRLRARRARIYYEAVHQLGGLFFWAGKNLPEEMGDAVDAVGAV